MNGNRRFYLLGALLCGLCLLTILLPSVTGEAQSGNWTPARFSFIDPSSIRLVGLDTDTGGTVSSSIDAYAAEAEESIFAGSPARTGQMDSSTPQLIDTPSQVTGEWITIFSDDFEGAFPGDWDVGGGDGDPDGEYLWGKRDCRPYAGSHSAWAVGGGADGSALPCESDYPDNADSVMIYGPFSLEDATQAELRFMLWLNTEPENERLWVGASTDGDFYGLYTYGMTDWIELVFDLTDVFTLGDLTGEDQVWVAIGFTSNENTTLPEGAYVDEVVLRKYVEAEESMVYLPLVVKNFPITPEVPVLNAISNPDGDGSYPVSWSSSVGASTYTLQEATNADFSDATTAYSGSSTSTAISGRDVATYYYRVRASNPYASSDWSNVESVVVTVQPQPEEWVMVTIPSDTNQGEYSSIAVGQGGSPHISFMDGTDVAVKYVRWDGNSWAEYTVDTLELYAYPTTALALDGNNRPQIAYPFNNPVRLGHAESDGQQWSRTHIDVGGTTGPLYADLALKADDEPCVSYLGWWMDGYDIQKRIRLLCRTAGSWPSYASTIVSEAHYNTDLFDIVRFHSLALDGQDRPHISFTRYANGAHELRYAGPDTSTYGDTVDDAPDVGFFSSLALDSQERPHISYYDLTNGDLKYSRWNGDQWIIETVDNDGDVGSYTSLALDGSDHPHMSYYDATNHALKYAFWDGSQWSIETVDETASVGQHTSLALDLDGDAHISYYNATDGRLRYATNSGGLNK